MSAWKAEVDEIAGPGIPLFIPLLVSPEGIYYRYRPLKGYRDAVEVAREFARGLNDPNTSVILRDWRRMMRPPGGAA
jgi:hypothetical protein